MAPITILHIGEYPAHRGLALRLKAGDKVAVREAAAILVGLLPEGTVTLIPVPSHTGRPTATLHLAQAVATLRGHAATTVFPYLRCRPHESRHDRKHAGADPWSLPAHAPHFATERARKKIKELSRKSTLVVLDDIADTGATIREAAAVTGAATAVVLDTTQNTSDETSMQNQRQSRESPSEDL